jgi:hypothetical protein
MPARVPLPGHLLGGHFRTSDASLHGISRGRLRSGDIGHPFHGVSSFGAIVESSLDRCREFEPLLRPGQVFSHLTAIALLGAPLPVWAVTDIHVSNLGKESRSRTRGVVGHRIKRSTPTAMLHGLPIIAPADAWCQVAPLLQLMDLIAVGDFLISGTRLPGGARTAPLCTPAELRLALARHAHGRGARMRAMALPRLRDHVDSRKESTLRICLVDAGFPEPETGVALRVDGGRLTLHPDLYWRVGRIVFEYEGEYHGQPGQFRRDILRRELFEAAGYHVIQVTAHDLSDLASFFRRVRQVRSRLGL